MITALSIDRGGLGRFGNQAFTIAGVIGIAIKSGQPYAFPEWKTIDNAIFGDPVDNIEDYLLHPLPRVADLNFQQYGYFWGYRDIVLPHGNWTIDAHMQSYKFFSHCIDEVRRVFTFKDEPEQNDYVAIHYRAGDYQDDETAQHPRCSKEYYERAMAMFPDSKFIVFSDDMKAAWEHLHWIDGLSAPASNYIEDFKAMKRCKHFITANSSFSLMAALLGDHPDKKIIMPSRWFGSSMPPEFTTHDIYPENAIII